MISLIPTKLHESEFLVAVVERLLGARTPEEKRRAMLRMGIEWRFRAQEIENTPDFVDDENGLAAEFQSENEEVGRTIAHTIADSLTQPSQRADAADEPSDKVNDEPKMEEKKHTPDVIVKVLPSLDTVAPLVQQADLSLLPDKPVTSNVKRPPGRWSPPTTMDHDRAREIGRRGEELVLRNERERVAARGQMPEQVRWISNDDPGSNYDILSVDEDGELVWIEVKATIGSDGKFFWPKAEFQKAVEKRDRYILWRVYLADTPSPIMKPFRDPISLLHSERLRIDVGTLSAEVEAA